MRNRSFSATFRRHRGVPPDRSGNYARHFLSAQHALSGRVRQLAPKRPVPDVDVRYYPYAGSITLSVPLGRVYVRLSDIFKTAPLGVHRALAFILVAKLLRRRAPVFYEKVYRDYACTPETLRASDLARRHRGRKMISSAQGRYYDLSRMFARLNRRYFDGQIEEPTLTWSQRRTRTILGHHDGVHETIVISKT